MKIKVKALHTLSGDYGMASAGDHIEIDEFKAKELKERGAIEFISKSDEKKAEESAKPSESLLINDRQKEASKSDEKEKKDLGDNPGKTKKK